VWEPRPRPQSCPNTDDDARACLTVDVPGNAQAIWQLLGGRQAGIDHRARGTGGEDAVPAVGVGFDVHDRGPVDRIERLDVEDGAFLILIGLVLCERRQRALTRLERARRSAPDGCCKLLRDAMVRNAVKSGYRSTDTRQGGPSAQRLRHLPIAFDPRRLSAGFFVCDWVPMAGGMRR
jgi:hypothetical protein